MSDMKLNVAEEKTEAFSFNMDATEIPSVDEWVNNPEATHQSTS